MEEIKIELIEKICEKQNFDELLLQIVKSNKENRINRILQNIEENKKFDKTYQMYVLRKDDNGDWKIRTFYKIKGNSTEEE